MPKPFLVDRRDPTRIYYYTELMARNPFLEESDVPPTHLAGDNKTLRSAADRAARLNVDQDALEKLRDGHALMLQSNTGQSDAKVKRDIDARATRRKTLLATAPATVVDEQVGMAQNAPTDAFELAPAPLPT